MASGFRPDRDNGLPPLVAASTTFKTTEASTADGSSQDHQVVSGHDDAGDQLPSFWGCGS